MAFRITTSQISVTTAPTAVEMSPRMRAGVRGARSADGPVRGGDARAGARAEEVRNQADDYRRDPEWNAEQQPEDRQHA